MASFDIVLRTRGSLYPHGEPSEFVSEYTGVIVCTDDETGDRTRVGKVAALRVHAGLAHNAGESLFDVCDSHSHELHVLHTVLYEPDRYHFRDAVLARFDAAEPDLLVLDYVILAPRWRQLKLGLLAVRKLTDMLGGGCGLAVSWIAPLRHDAAKTLRVPGGLAAATRDQDRATGGDGEVAAVLPADGIRPARADAVLRPPAESGHADPGRTSMRERGSPVRGVIRRA